jgi:tetratricopeptide (TPR) repeat protein
VTIQSKKLLLITGAVALVIVLYLLPTQIVSNKEKVASGVAQADYFSRILAEAKSGLKRQELEPLTKLEADLDKANAEGKITLLDSLGHSWQRLQVPALAAHYFDEKAKIQPTEKNEIDAATSYYDAFSIAGDSGLKVYLVQGAIRYYEKVISRNPDNLNAKTDLALCYAEGTNNPMQGIMMLRDVVSKDPRHENAQFNLGILSVKSGQFEKAAERFTKVIDINPKRYDVYFFRGSTYMRLNEKDKALRDFEKVRESGNPDLVREADNYIQQIKPVTK